MIYSFYSKQEGPLKKWSSRTTARCASSAKNDEDTTNTFNTNNKDDDAWTKAVGGAVAAAACVAAAADAANADVYDDYLAMLKTAAETPVEVDGKAPGSADAPVTIAAEAMSDVAAPEAPGIQINAPPVHPKIWLRPFTVATACPNNLWLIL